MISARQPGDTMCLNTGIPLAFVKGNHCDLKMGALCNCGVVKCVVENN